MNDREMHGRILIVLTLSLVIIFAVITWRSHNAFALAIEERVQGLRTSSGAFSEGERQIVLSEDPELSLPKVDGALYGYGGPTIYPCAPSSPLVEGIWKRYSLADSVVAMDMHSDDLWVAIESLGVLKWNTVTGDFQHYTQDDGLVHNYVTAISTDNNGDVWVGTRWSGVNHFDGTNWITYTVQNSSLPSNAIEVIEVDDRGDVWIGTRGGVARFDGSSWTQYTSSSSGLPEGERVVAIAFEGADVWFGVRPTLDWRTQGPVIDTGGIARLSDNIWYIYTSANSALASNFVSSIAVDQQGNKWIGTDAGLSKLTSKAMWENYDIDNSPLANNYVHDVAVSADGRVWIGTETGANEISGDIWTTFSTTNSLLVHDKVRATEIGEDGSVWFGTANGISRLQNDAFTTYSPSNWELHAQPRVVSAHSATGEIWVGTQNGIAQFDPVTEVWNALEKPWLSGYVESVNVAQNGDVWVGTVQDLSVVPSSDRHWITFSPGNSDLPNGKVTDILIHPNGDIWASFSYGDVVVLRASDATWETFSTNDMGLVSDYIHDIAVDQMDKLWFAANGTWVGFGSDGHWEGGGLCSLANGTDWTCYTTENSAIDAHNIYAVAVGKDGSVWLGTDDWVRRFKNETWTRFDYDTTNGALGSSDVKDVSVDEDGNVWFASDGGGVACYDGYAWSFYRYCNSPLDSDSIEVLSIDRDGDFFAVTPFALWEYVAIKSGTLKALTSRYVPGYPVLLYAYLNSTMDIGYPARSDVTVLTAEGEIPLYDDGTHGDVASGDGYYATWYQTSQVEVQNIELYVGSNKLAETTLYPVTNPELLVLTDIEALYAEFRDTGMTINEDLNVNGRADFYDLLDRLNQYTALHQGVLIDLPTAITTEKGFEVGYGDLSYEDGTETRHQMGLLIDELIYTLDSQTQDSIVNIAIVGDDQVVPFYRVFDPTDYYPGHHSSERDYPGNTQQNATLEDVRSAYIMSDLPYSIRSYNVITSGTWISESPPELTRPAPNMGMGRVFALHPHTLTLAIDRYEEPLFLTPGYAKAALFVSQPDEVDFPYLVNRSLFPDLDNWFEDQLTIYDHSISPWTVADFVTGLSQSSLTSAWGHSTHRNFSINSISQHNIVASDLRALSLSSPGVLAGFGCHLGLSVADHPDMAGLSAPFADALINPLMSQGVTFFAPSSEAYTWLQVGEAPKPNVHEWLVSLFINQLTDSTSPTVGDLWQQIFTLYHTTDPALVESDNSSVHFFHTTGAYGNIIYGLPTQRIERRQTVPIKVQHNIGDFPLNAATTFTNPLALTVDVPALTTQRMEDGSTLFSIPNAGMYLAPTHGPALPLVVRSLVLPDNTIVTGVRLVESQGHAYPEPVTLAQFAFGTSNGVTITGTYDLPSIYPEKLYQYQVINTTHGPHLTLSVIPMQYDTATSQATMYTHLKFEIEYIVSAPATGPDISQVIVNNGQPVQINAQDQSVHVEIVSYEEDNIRLLWNVRDWSGYISDSGNAPVNLVAGTTQVTFNLNSHGWAPGAKDLTIYIQKDNQVSDSRNVPIVVEGIGLHDMTLYNQIYPPDAKTATWQLAIRDENGHLISGLASNFSVRLDNQLITAQVQEVQTGVYEVIIPLTGISAEQHICRIQVTDNRGIIDWEEWRITKQQYRVYLPLTLKFK